MKQEHQSISKLFNLDWMDALLHNAVETTIDDMWPTCIANAKQSNKLSDKQVSVIGNHFPFITWQNGMRTHEVEPFCFDGNTPVWFLGWNEYNLIIILCNNKIYNI